MGVNTSTVDSGGLVWGFWGFGFFFPPVLLQYYPRVVYKFHGNVVST